MPPPDELHPAFRRLPGLHVGDPPIVMEAILAQVSAEQSKQVVALYLDSVTATLEANLKFVQGIRSLVAAGSK